jgi:ribosomal protein S18 acetylase RimI-like enzyme
MVVRRIRSDEWEALRDVRLRALADSPNAFGSTYARESEHDDEFWRKWASEGNTFVASDGDRLVALAAGYLDEERPGTAVLIAVWVAPEARGRALGEQLVEAVAGWARAARASKLRLAVALENEHAVALYRRTGFLDTGERERLASNAAIAEMVMERELD